MLKNYILVAIRLIKKNKAFSLINIFGLATGIACCIIISIYVQDELVYEKGFTDHDKVFLINTTWMKDGNEQTSVFSSPPIGMDMARELPEVEIATRVVRPVNVEQHIIRYNDKVLFEKNVFFVDSTFLKVFSYSLSAGDKETALLASSSILLSEKMAAKIFGDKTALGETLIINSGNSADTFNVTGIVAPKSFPSHVDADLYMSLNSNEWGRWVLSETTWANNNLAANYIKLHDPVSYKTVQTKMADMLEAKAGVELRQSGRKKTLSLQQLDDIRLHSNLSSLGTGGPGITYIYIICCIGILILALGCINFMNLTTARSAHRAGEVGVRKSMGAFKGNLIRQFLGEAFVIVIISLLAAFLIAELSFPLINPVIQKELQFTTANMGFILTAAATIGVVTALCAGSYPAFYLSSLQPTQVLKGKSMAGGSQWLRKSLVVFQFVITITLISAIVIIQNQLDFMQSKPLGFDTKQLVMIPLRTQEASSQYATLKTSYGALNGVREISATSSLPSTPLFRDWMVYKKGWANDQSLRHEIISVDENYFKTLQVPIVTGQDFKIESDNLENDTINPTRIIVNESSLKALQIPLDEAIGSTIYFEPGSERYEFTVIGVVKDFHQFSLHREIGPMIFMLPGERNYFPYMAVSIDMDSYEETYARMKTIWGQRIQGVPFEMIFADQNLKQMYTSERRMFGLLTVSTVIALFISGLGLYGLSVYVAERKTKEIGIRKVSGASVGNIISMLSKEYLVLILISFVLSVPLGYYVMNKWLENFAYKIEPGITIFFVSGFISFLVAWLTVSFESFRAARRNPVETLRN